MLSVTTVTGMPSRWSSQAVRRAPCRKGRVSSASTATFFPASTAPRITPSAVPYPAVANAPAYQAVFAKSLIAEAEADSKIVAITAAMPSGTSLDKFAERFPERCFDVGIAEQHGVTFDAGLATEGYKPFAAIYSTFLQRGYDQVVHDVAIQRLPVRFALDRAGLEFGGQGACGGEPIGWVRSEVQRFGADDR